MPAQRADELRLRPPDCSVAGRGRGLLLGWGLLALVLVASAARAQTPSAPQGELLDAVVALLDDTLITRGDLIFEARVEALRQGSTAAAWSPVDGAALARTLERSLGERLLSREAERLGVLPLGLQEREALVGRVEAQAGGPEALERFLARHGVDRVQLAALLERQVRASRALGSRLRVRAQVTEAEVRRHYASQAEALDRPYVEVRESLRVQLEQERAREVVVREQERLFSGARIRRLRELDPGADGPRTQEGR